MSNDYLFVEFVTAYIPDERQWKHPPQLYQQLRQELGRRDTFFNDMQALTRYLPFRNWDALWQFMAKGLEIDH